MRVVWCSWKAYDHPLAGGAEVVTDNILKRLVADGHEAILLTSRPAGSKAKEVKDGYTIMRAGSRYSVYSQARKTYKAHNLAEWADVVIDEINTIPFFAGSYSKKPTYLFVHQLAREVWFYQMMWPLSRLGYTLEPWYLRKLNHSKVITISQSTKQDLVRTAGFKPENITIITQGCGAQPLANLQDVLKYPQPTLLSFGAVRPMKRTDDIVTAFELAKAAKPDLRLIIAGDMHGNYGERVRKHVNNSKFASDIEVLGRVSDEKREEIMRQSWALAAASVKEGWGLIVTEANSQGTPVVGYDVDGLRDSIIDGKTGIVASPPTPKSLSEGITTMFSQSPDSYQQMRTAAWQESKRYTFDACYADFMQAIGAYLEQATH